MAQSPEGRGEERGGVWGCQPRLSAINNNNKRPVCLSLKRKCKLEAISCGSRSPDTLGGAAGSGGEVEIPSNSNYTQHKAAWGSGVGTVCQGLLQVSQPPRRTPRRAPTPGSW